MKFGLLKLPRSTALILIFHLVCALTLGVSAAGYNAYCEVIKQTPHAPEYPGAVLVEETSHPIYFALGDKHYTSTDSPDKIADFYMPLLTHAGSLSVCPNRLFGEQCYGDAVPDGRYNLYLDRDSYRTSGVTKFTVEFKWGGSCGWYW
jgi:hypothetical protein